jgi:hypothetical protein
MFIYFGFAFGNVDFVIIRLAIICPHNGFDFFVSYYKMNLVLWAAFYTGCIKKKETFRNQAYC